ncbi:DUF5808 domain-containing protein [Neobacillus sp. B4I6]
MVEKRFGVGCTLNFGTLSVRSSF